MFSETPVLSDSCGSCRDCRIHVCIQDYEKWREGAYAQDKLNLRTNAPSPLLSKVVCKKGGVYFLGAYGTTLYICAQNVVCFSFRSHQWKILSMVSWLTEDMHSHWYSHTLYFVSLASRFTPSSLSSSPPRQREGSRSRAHMYNRFSVCTTVEPA